MTNHTLYCSFCGKSQHEVFQLIAGPTVFICDECVQLCVHVVNKRIAESWASEGVPESCDEPRYWAA